MRDQAPSFSTGLENDAGKAIQVAGETYLDRICALAATAGLACDRLLLKDHDPWKGIVETAWTKECDLIVMGAHGRRGWSAFMLGSVTNKVLSQSKIPVLVYR